MEFFLSVLSMLIDALKSDFTLYGYTFSLWDVILTVIIASALTMFLKKLFE